MKLSGNACCSDFLLIGPTADTMRSFNKTLSVSSHCVYLETTADGEVGNRTDRGGDSGWKLGVLMLWTRTLSLLSQTSEPQSPSVKAFSCSTHSISCRPNSKKQSGACETYVYGAIEIVEERKSVVF